MGKTFDNILEKAVDYIGADNYSGFLNYLHHNILILRLAVKSNSPFTQEWVHSEESGTTERVLIEPSQSEQYLNHLEAAKALWSAIRASYIAYKQNPRSKEAELLDRWTNIYLHHYKIDAAAGQVREYSNSNYPFAYHRVVKQVGRLSEQDRAAKLSNIFSL